MNNLSIQSQHNKSQNVAKDKNLYIIVGVTLTAIMGGLTIAPIQPALAEKFNISSAALVMTVFMIPVGIATPILGVLADRIGIKKVLVPSLILFAVAGGFASFSEDFNTLLGWRFLQGLGAAPLDSLALTMIGNIYTGRTIATVMAINASVIGISSAIYPLIGGALGELDWRYPFLLAVFAFPLVMLVLMVLKLPKRPTDIPKQNLRAYLKNTWKSVNNRSVAGLLFAIGATFMIQFGAIITFIPTLAGNSFGSSEFTNGIILCTSSFVLALTASQLGKLSQLTSEINLIKISFLISALALFITPLLPSLWLLLIPNVLFGISLAFALPSSLALLTGLSRQDSRGGFMAVNASVQSMGQALGPMLGSFALSLWGIHGVFFSAATFAIISFVVFGVLLTPVIQGASQGTSKENSISISEREVGVEVTEQLVNPPSFASPTILQTPVPQLFHLETNKVIELPEDFSIITIGKLSKSEVPDINLSEFPHAEFVSRKHAQIRFDGKDYFIQDMGSANGTYINKYPMLPGIWYKIAPQVRIGFGKRDMVSFVFQIS
ncbi:MFS transporter [Mastigocoleus testarum]|uniref:Arabinose transporter permease n=1 Tax=Mastigocoleus testarum BC008 TaxID=371196 RepID=A0A0V7ZPS5_9CYAN|nr:MFS transporter [Mastigocoleus testarum]KST66127.1 arabinose transporter permease [Mastigocoleus testarum BC008]